MNRFERAVLDWERRYQNQRQLAFAFKVFWWLMAAMFGLYVGTFCRADDRPRAPIPRAPLIAETVTPPTPPKPSQPQQKSDLHSHLCQRCNVEWWHDPTKGPVSHNCPKCGRQQFVVNRTSPAGSRSTTPHAAVSPQQVDRGPASDAPPVKQKTVYVVGSTTCFPCQQFKEKHGDGTAELRYVYCYMNQPKPQSFDVATWNELVKHNNSGRFLWPFFVVRLDDGEFVALQAKVE
jgi:predicted RNA-binding Zn-ribbon protein involved in translation (DUF1610 family)